MISKNHFRLLLALVLLHESATARIHPDAPDGAEKSRVRYGVRFHPNRLSVIDGLAIGPFNFQSWRAESMLTVNGMNLEVPGIGIIPLRVHGNYMTVNGLDIAPFRYGGTCNGLSVAFMSSAASVRGASVGVITFLDSLMSGFQFSMVHARCRRMMGVQVAPLSFTRSGKGVLLGGEMAMADSMNGVSTGILTNTNYYHKGLQLGIINYAKHLRGVQIGLLNIAPNCWRRWMPGVLVARR